MSDDKIVPITTDRKRYTLEEARKLLGDGFPFDVNAAWMSLDHAIAILELVRDELLRQNAATRLVHGTSAALEEVVLARDALFDSDPGEPGPAGEAS